MYKLGETFQRDGFLELRQEGDLYLLKIGTVLTMVEKGCACLFFRSRRN